jgi:hypothetical protein
VTRTPATLAISIALLAVLAVAPPARAAGDPPSVQFERGRTAFSRGEYARAIQLLRPLIYPEVTLETEGEVVQAHRMLGVAHLFENQPDDARREFRKLLELRPDYRFDPLLDPPRVVDFFNAVVREEEDELAAIETKRRKREAELAAQRQREAERQRARDAVVVHLERHSYAVSLIPFGAGQFQNGDRRKGWVFFGTEAALAAASMGAFVTNFALFGLAPRRRCLVMEPVDANGLPRPCPSADIDRSDETLSTNLLRVQVGTGAAFFAVAIWGVIDAVRHFQRDVPLPAGPEAAPAAAKAAATTESNGLDLKLTATPFGLGATWRF